MFVSRSNWEARVLKHLEVFPVVGLLGPRQCGKTTLAQALAHRQPDFKQGLNYFDLEDPVSVARLEAPMTSLAPLEGLVVIDEVQRRPGLFESLRVLVDRPSSKSRFLVLGSASRDLLRQSSETLAGRIGYLELTPFSLQEVGLDNTRNLHLRGGFPRSCLAENDEASALWRHNFVRTFLERDVSSLGLGTMPETLAKFWRMLAHYHGQTFNASEIGASMGVSHTTVRRCLDALSGTFMVRQLSPWFENVGKRQIRSPKIYFRDSGILHALLRIGDAEELASHPKLGASWEGFALEETIRGLNFQEDQIYFWGVHGQTELDLFVTAGSRRIGFEFKYADAPKLTRSMVTACEVLRLDKFWVVYPGAQTYSLSDRATVLPLGRLEVAAESI